MKWKQPKKKKKKRSKILSDENVNKDIEESTRNVKNSDEATEVVKEMEKNH